MGMPIHSPIIPRQPIDTHQQIIPQPPTDTLQSIITSREVHALKLNSSDKKEPNTVNLDPVSVLDAQDERRSVSTDSIGDVNIITNFDTKKQNSRLKKQTIVPEVKNNLSTIAENVKKPSVVLDEGKAKNTNLSVTNEERTKVEQKAKIILKIKHPPRSTSLKIKIQNKKKITQKLDSKKKKKKKKKKYKKNGIKKKKKKKKKK